MAEEVKTGGGAAVGGNVETGGGRFIGHDSERANVNVSVVPPPSYYAPEHPSQYGVPDLVAALLGNPLKGELGLIAKMTKIEDAILLMQEYQCQAATERRQLLEDIEQLRRTQYPRWLQILMIVLATVMIVLLILFLFEMRMRLI